MKGGKGKRGKVKGYKGEECKRPITIMIIIVIMMELSKAR